mmetsp:Transcript_316/g.528  ORF Transcript_316/g.528 Transcript_316/m.528 type:complete len:196 (-) Transcript_316:72-659(-)
MMPNIPLHSLMEPSWTVPRDENLECSLFALEQQEQEYKAHLDRIANIAAPEPIGTRPSAIHPSSLSSSSNVASSIRFASGSSSNRPRAAMRRNRRSSGGGESATPTSRSGSYEYPTPTSASRRPLPNSGASSTGRGSRMYSRRFTAASDGVASPSLMVDSTAPEISLQWERSLPSPSTSTLRRDSMESFDGAEMG